jgi:hypothetical protein
MAYDFIDPDSLNGIPVNKKLYSGKGITIEGAPNPEEKLKFDINKTYGTPQKLLDNVVQVESSGNPYAINPESGAMGVGQFMPSTVAMLHKQGIEFNPFKANEAKAAMDYYINQLAKENNGDYVKAMKSYGGFKTKNPEKYLDQVLEGVDIVKSNPIFVDSESLSERTPNTIIPESELRPKSKTTLERELGIFARGATPAVTGAVIGAPAGPVGSIVGSMALPIGDVLNTGINAVTGGINKYAGTNISPLEMPSEVAQRWMTKAGLPVPETGPERLVETAGGALGSTAGQLPAFMNLAKTATSPFVKQLAETFSQSPKAQILAAPTGAVAGQATYEKTGSPVAAMAAGMVAGAPFGFKFNRGAINVPSQDALIAESNLLYDKVKNSGVSFDKKEFANAMQNIAKDLRQKGYSENVHTGIAGVLKELQDTTRPKDMLELQALRELIAGEQSDMKPKVKMLATELKNRFDDYVLNAPDTVIKGNKQGLQSWKEARTVYSKLSKAEIFDEMLEKSTRAASSPENSLTSQLRTLSNNPKRMRLFTQEEQDAIKQAATPGFLEKGLKGFGKFSPTNPLAALFNLELMHQLPYGIGSTIALGSAASKKLAGAQKVQNVTNLADMMRLGKAPELESRYKNIPATALRGLLSGQPTPKGQ